MATQPTSAAASGIAGIVLAGGLSRRMGGSDKSLLQLGAKPMLAHVIERLRGQASPLALSANGDPARFNQFGLPVIADTVEGFAGPLAGILAGLKWAQESSSVGSVVTVPSDVPFVPKDLVRRLAAGLGPSSEIAVARSRGRVHPIVGLWPVSMADELGHWLKAGNRAAHAWIETRGAAIVDFEDEGGFDPFFNVNTPEDVAAALRLVEIANARH